MFALLETVTHALLVNNCITTISKIPPYPFIRPSFLSKHVVAYGLFLFFWLLNFVIASVSIACLSCRHTTFFYCLYIRWFLPTLFYSLTFVEFPIVHCLMTFLYPTVSPRVLSVSTETRGVVCGCVCLSVCL